MKIALTGASGHIGTNLCRQLLDDQHDLRVLTNQYTASLEGLNLECVRGDILNMTSLRELADGAEVFIHLAASISINGDQEVMDTNVVGTKNVLDVVRNSKIKRFLHFSSIHALVHQPFDQPLDEQRPLAVSDHIIYNQSKALAEEMVLHSVEAGLDAVIINPTSVIGPNDFKPSLIGQAIIQLYNRKIPALIPGGYNWVDVRDVVAGTIRAIESGRTGQSYLLSGHFKTLSELNKQITLIHGMDKNLPVIPFWLAEIGVPFLKAWARLRGDEPLYTKESVQILKTAHPNISSMKAHNELGYESRPFKDTLRDTIEWFKENNYL
jgi:dihydroflavonol-4-reductase